MNFKKIINNLLKQFDLKISRYSSFEKTKELASKVATYSLMHLISPNYLEPYIQNIQTSKSQIAQDLFVLSQLGFKKNGYFIEFGATNGIDLSNTYLLEKKFDWKGILAEPAKKWHKELSCNRSAHIEKDCVWTVSDQILSFNEVSIGELSTIDTFSNSDMHSITRDRGLIYDVKTISLNDLLEKYNAPKSIDYLSIDTEGSEFEILSGFDFSEYKIKVITCEHNYTNNRQKIFDLLTSNGYERKHEELSQFDDWYVLTNQNNSTS
jgi:FkbM family methyltransferase